MNSIISDFIERHYKSSYNSSGIHIDSIISDLFAQEGIYISRQSLVSHVLQYYPSINELYEYELNCPDHCVTYINHTFLNIVSV